MRAWTRRKTRRLTVMSSLWSSTIHPHDHSCGCSPRLHCICYSCRHCQAKESSHRTLTFHRAATCAPDAHSLTKPRSYVQREYGNDRVHGCIIPPHATAAIRSRIPETGTSRVQARSVLLHDDARHDILERLVGCLERFQDGLDDG